MGEGRVDSSTFTLDAMMLFDMDLPGQTVEIMGKDLNAAMNRVGAPAANTDRTRLLYKIAAVVGDELAKEYDQASATEYTPLLSVDPRLEKTLVLSDLQLNWSPDEKAWYSTSSLGISSVGFEDINGRATGYLEIKPTEAGNVMNLFVQATADSWYYFSYQNNRLAVWAYNEEFCDLIGSKSKLDKAGSDEYAFFLSDIAETLTYVNHFRKTYLNIDEPYNFDIAPKCSLSRRRKKRSRRRSRMDFRGGRHELTSGRRGAFFMRKVDRKTEASRQCYRWSIGESTANREAARRGLTAAHWPVPRPSADLLLPSLISLPSRDCSSTYAWYITAPHRVLRPGCHSGMFLSMNFIVRYCTRIPCTRSLRFRLRSPHRRGQKK